jgi:hypothetical protein
MRRGARFYRGHDIAFAGRPAIGVCGRKLGWVGDNPFIFLGIARIRWLGWLPKSAVRKGVERTVDWLARNDWVFERRH